MKYTTPFNFVQVIIATFSAMSLSVLLYFIARAAGASMQYSGGLFAHLDFVHIVRFTVPTMVLLGLITFLIGRSRPGFCRIMQYLGLAALLVSCVVQFFFAQNLATGLVVAGMHVIVGAFWYIAVNNSNHLQTRHARIQSS